MDKQTIKYIRSLHQKKYRLQHNAFIVEGNKMVNELLQSAFEVQQIYAIEPEIIIGYAKGIEKISPKELERISTMKNPNNVLAVVTLPKQKFPKNDKIKTSLNLVLENIQDPGNMGTILRLANWYGISHIFCNNATVEIYNPKVVQASMGALFRVDVHYTDIHKLISESASWGNFEAYATHLDGEDIYNAKLETAGFIIMGNESKGLSETTASLADKKISIPSYPPGASSMESLNVGLATAITVAEFRRRMMSH